MVEPSRVSSSKAVSVIARCIEQVARGASARLNSTPLVFRGARASILSRCRKNCDMTRPVGKGMIPFGNL